MTVILAALTMLAAGCGDDTAKDNPGTRATITPARFGIQDLHYCFWDLPSYIYQCSTTGEALDIFGNLDDLRVQYIRYAVFWSLTERAPGVFDWSRHDDLIPYLAGKGMTVVLDFQGGNDIYDGIAEYEAAPYPGHPTSGYYDKWLAFIEATVTRYKGDVSHYEICNEPDLFNETGTEGQYWKPVPNAIHFSNLANGTADKIKSLQPAATVISGGVSVFNGYRAFLQGCFENGMLDHVDAVGLHPYRLTPEGGFDIDPDPSEQPTIEEEISSLKTFIATYKTGGAPVWNTESCYINTSYPDDTPRAQARFVSRSVLANHASGMEANMHFRLRFDTVVDPMFQGLIHVSPFEKRPAYTAYRNISLHLADVSVSYVKSVRKTVGADVYRLEYYSTAEKSMIAYWKVVPVTNDPFAIGTVDIEIEDIEPKSVSVVDIMDDDTDPLPGSFAETGTGVHFFALPVSDYPLLLIAEK